MTKYMANQMPKSGRSEKALFSRGLIDWLTFCERKQYANAALVYAKV